MNRIIGFLFLALILAAHPALGQDSTKVSEVEGISGIVNYIPKAIVNAYTLDHSRAEKFLCTNRDALEAWETKDSLNLQLVREGMAYRESRKTMIWVGPLAGAASLGLSFLMLNSSSCQDGDPAEINEECSDLNRILLGGIAGITGFSFVFKGFSSLIFPSGPEAILKNRWDKDHDTRHLSQHYELGGCFGIWKGFGGMEKFGYQTLRGMYFGIGRLPWSFQGELLWHRGQSNKEYSYWDGLQGMKTKNFNGGMVTANWEYFPFLRKRTALGYGLGIGYQGWGTMSGMAAETQEKAGLEPEMGIGGFSLYLSQEYIFWNSEWANTRISTRLGYPFVHAKMGEDLDGPNLSVYLKMGFSLKDWRGL